ncbi:MAG: ribosomal RNA small subunit methyltransferase A [Candidatus Omnitrophica bacterium]|nr:ribosomal RNA small subunit methyltransferase A [Candidatus Omnitrophota bacterium]
MLSQSEVIKLFKEHNIRVKKRFGQNFLIDKNINKIILEEINLNKRDIVIEIGAGFGGLACLMAETADRVFAVELDRKLAGILREKLSAFSNAKVIEGDFLEFDLKKTVCGSFNKKIKVIGNLPYYISSPVVFRLIEYKAIIKTALIMTQKEVARRFVACPGGKERGILSCLLSYYGKSRIVKYVNKNSFFPRPKVDSALVRIDFFTQPPFKVSNEDLFKKVVKGAFSKRRKNILNSLSSCSGLELNKPELSSILEELKIDFRTRAEQLKAEELAEIANLIVKKSIS